MAAINVVRFRVKPGEEQRFIEFHRQANPGFKGFQQGWLVKTGGQGFCFVGVWKSYQSIVDARAGMIGMLDGVRQNLEDLGGGLGVTDPVSGEVVLNLALAAPKKKKPAVKKRAAKRPATKAAKKKPATAKKTARKR
jgi:hypothetical protein